VGVFSPLLCPINVLGGVMLRNGAPTWILKNVTEEHLCSEIDICPDAAYVDSYPI